MKISLFLIFFLVSFCTQKNVETNAINNNNFSKKMNISEFILKLETYSTNNDFPNIDY